MGAAMKLLDRLLRPRPDPRDALRPLWLAIVSEARRPAWYAVDGVPDTVAGRFDVLTAVLALAIARMDADPGLAADTALVTELFVHDMDGQLREFGVGDVVVGKHIGKLMGAMGGRLAAYRAGAADEAAMTDAVRRNMTLCEGAVPEAAAARLLALAQRLARTSAEELRGGAIAA